MLIVIFISILIMSYLLNNRQDVLVDESNSLVTFQTQHINGGEYYFHLTLQQFDSLNDAIILINSKSGLRHFPLGRNMWLYYDGHQKAKLYIVNSFRHPFFKFENFAHYKNNVHRKLMSLLRSTHVDGLRKRGRGGRRLQQERKRGVAKAGEHPHSYKVQSSHRLASAGADDRREQTLHGATDDANMSDVGDASAILSEWDNTNTRRQCEERDTCETVSNDSVSSLDSVSEGEIDFDSTISIE